MRRRGFLFTVLVLVALIVAGPVSSQTAIFGEVDIGYRWDFDSVGDEVTFSTGTCAGTNASVMDASLTSQVQMMSCRNADDPSRVCVNAGLIKGYSDPIVVGVAHGYKFLRVRAVKAPSSGFATVRISCHRSGFLAPAEMAIAMAKALSAVPHPLYTGSRSIEGALSVTGVYYSRPYFGFSIGGDNTVSYVAKVATKLGGRIVTQTLSSVTDAVALANARWILSDGRFLYVVTGALGDTITSVDIRSPEAIAISHTLTNAAFDDLQECKSYETGIVCTSMGNSAVVTVEFTVAGPPLMFKDSITGPTIIAPEHLVVERDSVFVSGSDRLMSFKIGNMLALTLLDVEIGGQGQPLDGVDGLALSGDGLLYASGSESNTFSVYDSTQPGDLTRLGFVRNDELLSGASTIIASERWAYVLARKNSRLTLIDVTDPSNPKIVSSVSFRVPIPVPGDMLRVNDWIFVFSATDNTVAAFDIGGLRDPVTSKPGSK